MKAIYTNIAVIVLTLVAVYFSLEQSRKFEQVQTARLGFVTDNEGITDRANKAALEQKQLKLAFEDADKKRIELQASVDTRKTTADGLRAAIAKHEAILSQVEDQKQKLAAARRDLDEMLGGIGANLDIDNLDRALSQVEDQKANRVAALDEIDVAMAKTQEQIKNNKAELANLVKREEERVAKLKRSALEAVVTGVNQEWGFIVIGAGANSGFTPQSGLIVQRDGQMIARVRPSAIEPTQTIAEINFNSLLPGVRIQPGDRVIFEVPSVN